METLNNSETSLSRHPVDTGKFNDSLPNLASLTCWRRVTKVHAEAVATEIFFGFAWFWGIKSAKERS